MDDSCPSIYNCVQNDDVLRVSGVKIAFHTHDIYGGN